MVKLGNKLPALIAGLTLTWAACGDEGTGSDSGELSQAEISSVYSQLSTLMLGAFFGFSPSVSSPFVGGPSFSGALVPIDQTVDNTQSCTGGGTISINGTISGDLDNAGVGTLTIDITEDINECVINTGTTEVTTSGNPNLRMQGTFDFGGTTVSATFTITGGITFTSTGGGSGSCTFDLDISVSGTTATGSGSICGQEFRF